MLNALDQPALLGFDAHGSEGRTERGHKDSPLIEELQLVLSHRIDGHVVLIYDARAFVGAGGYPTIAEIRRLS